MIDKKIELMYTLSNGKKKVYAKQSIARAIRKRYPDFQIVQVQKIVKERTK